MSFGGFPDDAFTFYAGLELDNSREYWLANKATFEAAVKRPMLELTEALADFGPAKIFRPNRDVRFSADKSPYRTNHAALVGRPSGAGYYLALGCQGLEMGGGFHAHSPAQTAKLRQAIDEDASGAELGRLVETLEAQRWEVLGDRVKTTPRGYAADHPRIALLRLKELLVIREVDPAVVSSPELVDVVVAGWRQLDGLMDWLDEAVA